MRFYDKGSTYGVYVSAHEVQAFADHWPCSGLPFRSIWFEFDKRNDDLVDVFGDDDNADTAAILALADDAQAYGQRKL